MIWLHKCIIKTKLQHEPLLSPPSYKRISTTSTRASHKGNLYRGFTITNLEYTTPLSNTTTSTQETRHKAKTQSPLHKRDKGTKSKLNNNHLHTRGIGTKSKLNHNHLHTRGIGTKPKLLHNHLYTRGIGTKQKLQHNHLYTRGIGTKSKLNHNPLYTRGIGTKLK